MNDSCGKRAASCASTPSVAPRPSAQTCSGRDPCSSSEAISTEALTSPPFGTTIATCTASAAAGGPCATAPAAIAAVFAATPGAIRAGRLASRWRCSAASTSAALISRQSPYTSFSERPERIAPNTRSSLSSSPSRIAPNSASEMSISPSKRTSDRFAGRKSTSMPSDRTGR